jgi:DNA-binding transcriptional LysR family regulator
MELRHLRYFIALAEELHFGRAAEKLCIAQPPLSQQIQQLEREIGFKLFARSSRKVELTPAGRVYLDEVRATMAALEKAVFNGRRVERGEIGRLAIGFVGTATYAILPESLRRYRSIYPEVDLTLRELVSARQVQALREHRIQVGFARPAITDSPDIVCESVATEPFVAALPENHRLAKRSGIPLAALSTEEFVLFPRTPKPSYGDLIFDICEAVGFRPNVTQETAEIQTAVSLVAGGMGVTLVPASASNVYRHGVVFVPILEPVPSSVLTVVYRSDDESPTLKAFLNIVRAIRNDIINRIFNCAFDSQET